MKKILTLISLAMLTSCVANTISKKALRGTWYVFEEPSITYTFVNDSVLSISDSIEGEDYFYCLKGDTLIYRQIGDNSEVYKIVLDVNSKKTIFVTTDSEGFTLRRNKRNKTP